MSAASFKEIQGISCSSSRIYNSVCLDLNPSWGRGATTITFLSLRPLHFLSFYLQPKPRRSQMWRNVTLYDRWVCVRVCVCVYIICLLLPICPRFCHIFLLYEHQQKNWSPHTAWLHPTSVTGKGHFLHKLGKFDRLAVKMHYEMKISTIQIHKSKLEEQLHLDFLNIYTQ